jgi:hypothetical protein
MNTNDENPLQTKLAIDRGKNGEALEAKHGNFSEKYFRTMTAALTIAPGVVKHVVSLINASGGTEDRVDGTREAPLPMSTQAFADANEIYSLMVYWASVFAGQLHQNAPSPAERAWRNRRGTIVGLPADISIDSARFSTAVMATWLRLRLDTICALDPDDVQAFHDGLRYVFQTDARWPQEAKARYSDMPCPNDGCKGKIAVYPPRDFGDDERIVCEGCGRHFLPEQYEHLIGVFKQMRSEEAAEAEKAKRIAHLSKKYIA